MADLIKRPAPTALSRQAPPPAGPAPIDVQRYAQLTYTSFDGGAPAARASFGGPAAGQRTHGGGWQVKQVVGDLDPAFTDELTARITTRFDLQPSLPAFPTPDQIEHRPARLAYAVVRGEDRGGAAWWHTVDAGRDGTGRPGNVFAHLIATTGGGRSGFRPIELWGWPGWLNPYGPEAVMAAVLPDGPPALVRNPALSLEATVSFLLDPARDRLSVVRVLLDAVAARLSGQTHGPVVLAVDDHDRAAQWIAAVSHFLSPAGADRLSWSTHDSPEAIAAGGSADAHIVCTPRARLADLGGHPHIAALIDEDEEPYLGTRGSAHRLASGTIEVTPLSVLAEAVLADDEIALRVLRRRDAVAAAFEARDAEDGETLSPDWPIAVAVLEERELVEFHPDAAVVVVDEAPSNLSEVGWAAELVDATLRANPPTPDDALRRLGRAARRGRGTELLAQTVLAAGATDPQWLDGIDLADVPVVGTAPLGAVRAELTARCAALAGDQSALRAALRLAEVIERLGARDDDLDAVRSELAATVAAIGPAELVEPGWAQSPGAGDISEPTMAGYVRPVFADRSPAELAEISAELALWLYGATDGVRYALPESVTAADDYLFGFTTRAVLADSALGIPADARAHYAAEAVRGALRSDRLDNGQCRALVGQIVDLARPPATDLLEFSKAVGRVPPQILDSLVFYGEIEDAALRAILDSPGSATPELVAAAWLRLAQRTGEVADRDRWCASVATLAESKSSVPQPGSTVTWVTQAAEELVVMTAAGFVVGQSIGAPWADPETGFCASLRDRMAGVGGAPGLYSGVVEELSRAERSWMLKTDWVVGHALTVEMGLPGAGAGPMDGLGSPSMREPGQLVPWSQRLIDERIAAGDYRGPTDIVGLRDAAWLVVRGRDAATAERFFADYRRIGEEWLARTGPIARANGPAAQSPPGRGGLG